SSGYMPSNSPPTPPTTPQQTASTRALTRNPSHSLTPSNLVKNDFSSIFNNKMAESCKEASLPISLSSPNHINPCDSHHGGHFAEPNSNWSRFVESHSFYSPSDALSSTSQSLVNESSNLLT